MRDAIRSAALAAFLVAIVPPVAAWQETVPPEAAAAGEAEDGPASKPTSATVPPTTPSART